MRVSIIDMVLATDMSQHFEHLTKFNALIVSLHRRTLSFIKSLSLSLSLSLSPSPQAQDSEGPGPGSAASLSKEGQEARQVLKRVLVKCADISNPLRPMRLCREWAGRIAREYFTQVSCSLGGRGLPLFPFSH